jgi:3-oxoacyl-(acyl-carrier-protein) synthase
VDFALTAAAEALEQAGIRTAGPTTQATEMGVILGSGIGCSHSLLTANEGYSSKGIKGVRPTTVPRCMANAISSQVSMKFRLTGPNYVVVSACTSATTAIGISYRMIKDGIIDMILTGGSDAPFEPRTYCGWNNLGVMSTNPEPEKSCRPFDADRDGCVLGEGAGMLVLESLESALKRKAVIRGEICGFGESSDASHITRPSPEGQASAITSALKSAGMTPADIGFINAHGTATETNDECEAKSIRLAMGTDTDRIPTVSNKSYFGHTLGASGAIETIVTILGLEKGVIPGNLNLDNPDPLCNLCLVGKEPLKISATAAMKNSFGFGGNNAVLILRRFNG